MRVKADPIIDACEQVALLLEMHSEVITARRREDNPRLYPGYCIPLSPQGVANRIIGELLEDGWTPPARTESKTSA